LPSRDLIVEYRQLGQEYGGLQGIEAAVNPHTDVMVPAVLTMPRDLANDLGELRVRREDGAAVAVAAERLRREEAGAADHTEIARLSSLVAGAEALCRVFDHRQPVPFGYRVDRVEIGALAVKRYGNYRPRTRRDRLFYQPGIDVAGRRVYVHVNRP